MPVSLKSGAIAVKFPPAPVNTQFQGPGSLSGFGKAWVDWFTAIVNHITSVIAALIAVSFQNFTQSTLPTLTPQDAGALIHVTDFNHVLQWTGTGWEWGPGDAGGGYIQGFLTPPVALGWHICDGSTVGMLNGDGSVTQVHLPDYTTAAYLKLGKTLLAGPNAPSGLTDATDVGAPSGVISPLTFNGTPGTTGVESADLSSVATTGAATAAAQNHTHTFTPQGTIPTPTFTGNDPGTHTHGPGTLDLQNTVLLAYFRK